MTKITCVEMQSKGFRYLGHDGKPHQETDNKKYWLVQCSCSDKPKCYWAYDHEPDLVRCPNCGGKDER